MYWFRIGVLLTIPFEAKVMQVIRNQIVKSFRALLTGCVMLSVAGAAHAQDYPTKPIRAIVPFVAGGPTDIMARALGQKLSAAFGKQFIIDNRAGGGGLIAATMAKEAPADGYTIFFGTISTLATNVATSNKLPYDPVKDYAPITLTSSNPYFMVVHPTVPANSVKEFIALAKAKPGQLNYASSGTGGGSHMAMEMFRTMAGLNMVHIPYKGSGQSVTEVLAGQVQMTFIQPSITITHAKAGKLKVLGVTGKNRLASWKDAAPIGDAVPGYEASSWQGVLAPANTPKPIIDRLHAEIVKALKSPEISGRLVAEGSEIGGISPEEFGRYIRTEIVKWKKVVKDANIQVE
jgi:tripartite-type tricarboxylate transporter receptor subunit TctC